MADSELVAPKTDAEAAAQARAIVERKRKVKEGDTFHLKIYAPFKTYFDGDVTSVSAINLTGEFDILAGHHNFLTLLAPCDIIARGETEEKFTISRGIMHVKADEVTVFLDV